MTKKKLIIGGLIGIGCATVGYILGRHSNIDINEVVKDAYTYGVDCVLESLYNDEAERYTEEEIDKISKFFIDDFSPVIDLKTGAIGGLLPNGTYSEYIK